MPKDPTTPNRIRVDGDVYQKIEKRAQEPALEDVMSEEGVEEDAPPASGDFSFRDFDPGDDGIAAMGRMVVVGLAITLAGQGVTKDALKKAKLTEAATQIPQWLKSIINQRAAIKAELRLLQRYGPSQYLQRRARDLRSVA